MALSEEMLTRSGETNKEYLEESFFGYALMSNILGDQFRTNPDLRKYAFYSAIVEFQVLYETEMTHRALALKEIKEGNFDTAMLCYKNALQWRVSYCAMGQFRELLIHKDMEKILTLKHGYGKIEKKLIEVASVSEFDLAKYHDFLEEVIEFRDEISRVYDLLYFNGESWLPSEKRPPLKHSEHGYELIKLYEKAFNFRRALEIAQQIEDENEQERIKNLLHLEPIHPNFEKMLKIKEKRKMIVLRSTGALAEEVKEEINEMGRSTIDTVDGLVFLLSKIFF